MERKQLPAFILIGALAVLLIVTILLATYKKTGDNLKDSEHASLGNHTSQNGANGDSQGEGTYDEIMLPDPSELEPITEEPSTKDKYNEGVVTFKGKKYRYNTRIKTYLFMGVDKDGKVGEGWKNYYDGGQSDAMFLLVANPEDKTLSVVSIQRNSMTNVMVCDEKGKEIAGFLAQICLAHGYGDGRQLSCSRAVNSVRYLFNYIEIEGYFALNMGGLPAMNDGLGGVDVTVLEDIPPANLKKGAKVHLTGKQAYYYLRWRDQSVFDSASGRLRRQEQYITTYMTGLNDTAKRDPEKALQVFNSIDDYAVTNIDFVELVDELADYEYNENRLYTVPGETKMGKRWEEYHVDRDGLDEIIYKLFYKPVEE